MTPAEIDELLETIRVCAGQHEGAARADARRASRMGRTSGVVVDSEVTLGEWSTTAGILMEAHRAIEGLLEERVEECGEPFPHDDAYACYLPDGHGGDHALTMGQVEW